MKSNSQSSSGPHSMLTWENLDLVKKLHKNFKSCLDGAYKLVLPLLVKNPPGGEEYTDHGIQHSIRIIERIGKIIPKTTKLNQPELYILLLASLLHDLGMWIPNDKIESLLEDNNFCNFCDEHYKKQFQVVKSDLNSPEREWMAKRGLQYLAAAYGRANHNKFSADLLLSQDSDESLKELRSIIGKDYIHPVAWVCEAHGWDRRKVLEDEKLRLRQINGEEVNFRLIAFLLRLGDLLDLDEGRVSTFLWKYLGPFNAVSESHWQKQKLLRFDFCSPDLIEISGTFDTNNGGTIVAEAYNLACKWLEWLGEEINEVRILQSICDEKIKDRYKLGKLELRKNLETIGIIFEGNLKFKLDPEVIIKLLGEEIYIHGCVFVRELIQNAVDATRTQVIRDQSKSDNELKLSTAEPWNWPESITGHNNYAIEILTGSEEKNGISYDTFSICDQGIGMTLQQIKDYFLQIGKSYYQSDTYKKECNHSSISKFGIGFLSCLLVADIIEVRTRPRNEAFGLKLTLKSPDYQILIEKDTAAKFGTTVKLWINQTIKRRKGWDELPINENYLMQALSLPNNLNESKFIQASYQWSPWIEFQLLINGKAWGPRKITRANALLNNQDAVGSFHTFPLWVYGKKGLLLAEGNFTVPALSKNNLPIFPKYSVSFEYNSYCISSLGILLAFGGSSSERYHLNLNFFKIPKNILSAGRITRSIIIKKLKEKISKLAAQSIYNYLFDHLRVKYPVELPLWRLPIDINDKEELPPFLLPFRTRRDSGWATEEDILVKFSRFLLVPFNIALNGPWNIDIPYVGYLYPRIHRKLQFVDRCKLITIENTCTALLYPPNASIEGLSLFKGQVTYSYGGLAFWLATPMERKLKNALKLDSSYPNNLKIIKNELPDYDKRSNPWSAFYDLPESIWKREANEDSDKFLYIDKIRRVLENIPPLEFPDDLLRLNIDEDTSDWE
ncbi:MAG: ATP-binding protein [Candidatus Aminicenantes bacterium]|nr:ATP-binding protein [Candidatus Aminicenantes bacterium]